MRTFVQVYLLTILALKRIQIFLTTFCLRIQPVSFFFEKILNPKLFIIDYASWSKMETRNRKLAEDIESQLHKTHHEKRNVRFER